MTVYTRDTTLSQPTTAPTGSGAEFRAGTVTLANSAGLPSGVLIFSGGTLLVGVNATLNSGLRAADAGAPTPGGLSAKHGVSVTLTGPIYTNADSSLIFGGAPGADGAIVLSGSQLGSISAASAVDIRAGVLRIAGSAAQNLFDGTGFTSIQQGATLDIGVSYQILSNFASLGVITSSGGGQTLALTGSGTLGGQVTGALQVYDYGYTTVTGVVAANTFVQHGATLQIGTGGVAGSATISNDDGAVIFDRSDACTLSAPINGLGSVAQAGSGTLTLSGYSSYAGGTTVSAGVLVDAGYGGVGSGLVTLAQGGEFVVLLSQNFANGLSLTGGVLAAGHGAVVGLTGAANLAAGADLSVGDTSHDGAVVFAGETTGELSSLTVEAGTLAFGTGFVLMTSNDVAQSVTVNQGAVLDLNGSQLELPNLFGKGLVTSTGGPAYLQLVNADFSGTLSGPLQITVVGENSIHGAVALTTAASGFKLDPDARLTFDQAVATPVSFFHPVAPGHIDTSPETLVLNDSVAFTGVVSGWSVNDTIDLRDVAFTSSTGQLSFDASSDALVVTDGRHVARIHLVGAQTAAEYAYADDGSGHVVLSYHG